MLRNSYAFRVRHRNGWGTGFGPAPTHCAQCSASLPVTGHTGATGYGCGKAEPLAAHPAAPTLKKGESLERSPAICYTCCGKNDERDMQESGQATLYVTLKPDLGGSYGNATVSNWPGSLSLQGRYKKGRHNIARQRVDVWFTFGGANWHGVNIGDNQILRCKRMKG